MQFTRRRDVLLVCIWDMSAGHWQKVRYLRSSVTGSNLSLSIFKPRNYQHFWASARIEWRCAWNHKANASKQSCSKAGRARLGSGKHTESTNACCFTYDRKVELFAGNLIWFRNCAFIYISAPCKSDSLSTTLWQPNKRHPYWRPLQRFYCLAQQIRKRTRWSWPTQQQRWICGKSQSDRRRCRMNRLTWFVIHTTLTFATLKTWIRQGKDKDW